MKKIILIAVLSVSNLAILGLIFHNYSSSRSQISFFSVSEGREDLERKIEQECQSDLEAVLKADQRSFICSVSLQKKHKGVPYTFKTRFKVSKRDGKIKIQEISGQLRDTKEHITEAEFCGNCTSDKELEDSATQSITELMKEVLIIAAEVHDTAQDSVEKAYENYEEKDNERKLALIKESNCEGVWNLELEEFEEFTETEDKLNCRLKQISNLNSPLEVESFYHDNMKKELWHMALSNNEYLLENNLLNQFKDPYRNSLSIRSSIALLENYQRWKEDFDILESLDKKTNFLRSISEDIRLTKAFMTEEQAQQDIYYLNKAFDGLLYQSNQNPQNLTPTSIQLPIDYGAVSEEVKKLYE
ncbi:MAG: hypothetical protein OXC37_00345 [Bdellovibrionaceae bacterium]|nr:hypothetical protein [Pseudobdellovibrionaceae bacterium]